MATAATQGELARHRLARWHTTKPNSWDRARVVDAFRAWARETGDAPRSYEWNPATGRSLGHIGRETTKWEREHPRFPGSTTVYRYFGSWTAAMTAAGLPPRTRARQGTLAERVDAARRLHATGLPVAEIADHLELAPTTVYRYLKAHPCDRCAGPVVGDGRLCQPCTTRAANPQRWRREEVLELVNEWVRLEGRPPTVVDWSRPRHDPTRRWEREFPRWPPQSVGRILFGSWNAMLDAAGHAPNHPYWQPDEIIAALHAFAEREGRAPTKHELEWPPAGVPSAKTVRMHFGSFTAGLRAAGIQPVGRWTREDVAAAIARFAAEHGRAPRPQDWANARWPWPNQGTVRNRFGTWEAALAAAGVEAAETPATAAERKICAALARHGELSTTRIAEEVLGVTGAMALIRLRALRDRGRVVRVFGSGGDRRRSYWALTRHGDHSPPG